MNIETKTASLSESDDSGSAFRSAFRMACRRVYEEEFNIAPMVSHLFGDSLCFYALVSGIGFATARALANAGFFYPNDVVRARDLDLLAVNGIGWSRLGRIRRNLNELLPGELTVSVLLDRMLGESRAIELDGEIPHYAEFCGMNDDTENRCVNFLTRID
ncbi:MAG TPA: hypothetical protein VN256_13095 [Pyrinomonadaceae bacterium]|nr:hypothetical protein [Pyrinomonadaceae bacterium]